MYYIEHMFVCQRLSERVKTLQVESEAMTIAAIIENLPAKMGRAVLALGLGLGLFACGPKPQPATPATAALTAAVQPSQAAATDTPVASATPKAPSGDEAVLILAPGPGSRLVSPIHLSGEADPTFEQTLGVRLLADDGTELAGLTTTIHADAGQRGPFDIDIPFSLSQPRQAFIQVFAASARDGGVTHLASVGVQLAPDGVPDIRPVETHPEQITILEPTAGAVLSGGSLHLAGYGWAGFEQTLVISVYDLQGDKIGEQPVIVNAPDMGQPGPFEADVPYTLTQAGPGRVTVRDVSPAFGGDTHVTSVEVRLEP